MEILWLEPKYYLIRSIYSLWRIVYAFKVNHRDFTSNLLENSHDFLEVKFMSSELKFDIQSRYHTTWGGAKFLTKNDLNRSTEILLFCAAHLN